MLGCSRPSGVPVPHNMSFATHLYNLMFPDIRSPVSMLRAMICHGIVRRSRASERSGALMIRSKHRDWNAQCIAVEGF